MRLDHPMIIQTILLDPSGAVWTDEASNLSRPDRSGADQIDAEHPTSQSRVARFETHLPAEHTRPSLGMGP
jgi:hypothetical protein